MVKTKIDVISYDYEIDTFPNSTIYATKLHYLSKLDKKEDIFKCMHSFKYQREVMHR